MVKNFLNKPLGHRIFRGIALALALGFLSIVIPTPYRIQGPGLPELVRESISISSKTYPSQGAFVLPTVVSESASLIVCLYGIIDPAVVLIKEVGEEPQAQSPSNQGQMALSQRFSTIVALEELGHKVRGLFSGFEVLSIDPSSPNLGVLRKADRLRVLDNEKLASYSHFKEIIHKQVNGILFPAIVERNKTEVELELSTYQPKERMLLGVKLKPLYRESKFPFEIRFSERKTIGASGGLVFALDIYDQLVEEDLTRGRIIAATGTITPDGKVGEIEGVNFKLACVIQAKADIFLVPRANFNQLGEVPDNLEVIPVDNFKQALHALKQ